MPVSPLIGSYNKVSMLPNPVTGALKVFTVLQKNASVVSQFESTNLKSNPLAVFSTNILYIC